MMELLLSAWCDDGLKDTTSQLFIYALLRDLCGRPNGYHQPPLARHDPQHLHLDPSHRGAILKIALIFSVLTVDQCLQVLGCGVWGV